MQRLSDETGLFAASPSAKTMPFQEFLEYTTTESECARDRNWVPNPPSHRTSLEPESGTGIFTAEIEVEHLRWYGAAVESHSARLRGRRRGIESIEPAVQFTFRSRPCQYFSLSSRRSIFPVAVRGKASMNSTLLGALKAATRSRAQRITSWGSGLLPGFG